MRSLKLAISGAHSTGKTTFINDLTALLIQKEIEYAVIGDLAIKCPLPILKDHTVESTLWIASQGIQREIEAQHTNSVVIVDRSILDCWAYFNVICKDKYANNNPKLLTLKNLINNWHPTYDIIYQTQINKEIPIEDNKGRLLDEDYRDLIEREMNNAFENFNVLSSLITTQNKHLELKKVYNHIVKFLAS